MKNQDDQTVEQDRIDGKDNAENQDEPKKKKKAASAESNPETSETENREKAETDPKDPPKKENRSKEKGDMNIDDIHGDADISQTSHSGNGHQIFGNYYSVGNDKQAENSESKEKPFYWQPFHVHEQFRCKLNLPQEELDKAVAALQSDHLVVVSGFYNAAALSAVELLIEDQLLDGLPRFQLHIDKNESKFGLALDVAEGDLPEKAKAAVMVIDVEETGSSILSMDEKNFGSLCKVLEDSERYLIFVVQPTTIKAEFNSHKNRLFARQLTVPFLAPLFRKHYGDEADQLLDMLRIQCQKGCWPGSEDDESFYGFLADQVHNHHAQLTKRIREISANDNYCENTDHEDAVDRLLKPRDGVQRELLFLVAFLGGIPQYDFIILFDALLGTRTGRQKKKILVRSKKGKKRKEKTHEEVPLTEIWESRRDAHLQKAGLHSSLSTDGVRHVQLQNPGLLPLITRQLQYDHSEFYRKRFEILLDSGVLFDPEISNATIEKLLRAIVRYAEEYRRVYDSRLLMDMLVRLFPIRPEIEGDLQDILRQLVEANKDEGLEYIVLLRLAELIQKMYVTEHLQEAVKDFLSTLINWGLYVVLLPLLTVLTRSTVFDVRYWYKRVLNEAPYEIKHEAMNNMIRSAHRRPERFYHSLEEMSEWWPDQQRPIEHIGGSAMYSILYFFLAANDVQWFRMSKWKAWPPPLSIYIGASEDPAEMKRQLQLLLRGFTHPLLPHVLYQINAEESINVDQQNGGNLTLEDLELLYEQMIPGIIERIATVALGPGGLKDPSKPGMEYVKSLFRAIPAAMGKKRTKLLAKAYRGKVQHLREETAAQSFRSRQQELLKQRYDFLKFLRAQLSKSISKSLKKTN